MLDLNDLVAGCSCVNILKLLLQIILVVLWKSQRLLCVPPSLYCIHDKLLLLDIYITVLVIILFLMHRYGTSPWSLLHLYTERGVESH